uniref:(northern house mosquito) hypothetical protein n=1 Tax=Culex pipiens TaxID=7175 RepID=A0A8D8NB00_CULPI
MSTCKPTTNRIMHLLPKINSKSRTACPGTGTAPSAQYDGVQERPLRDGRSSAAPIVLEPPAAIHHRAESAARQVPIRDGDDVVRFQPHKGTTQRWPGSLNRPFRSPTSRTAAHRSQQSHR